MLKLEIKIPCTFSHDKGNLLFNFKNDFIWKTRRAQPAKVLQPAVTIL
jgi:hypothetical protein